MEYWVAKFPKTATIEDHFAKIEQLDAFDIELLHSRVQGEIWFYENTPGVAEEIRQKVSWITSLTLQKPLMFRVKEEEVIKK